MRADSLYTGEMGDYVSGRIKPDHWEAVEVELVVLPRSLADLLRGRRRMQLGITTYFAPSKWEEEWFKSSRPERMAKLGRWDGDFYGNPLIATPLTVRNATAAEMAETQRY
jgi:hypothetical protein